MELINLRRRSGVIPKQDVVFGSHPHGIRCEAIKITPQEIVRFLSSFENRGIKPEETLRTFRRYLYDLTICFTPPNDRNEQSQVDS